MTIREETQNEVKAEEKVEKKRECTEEREGARENAEIQRRANNGKRDMKQEGHANTQTTFRVKNNLVRLTSTPVTEPPRSASAERVQGEVSGVVEGKEQSNEDAAVALAEALKEELRGE